MRIRITFYSIIFVVAGCVSTGAVTGETDSTPLMELESSLVYWKKEFDRTVISAVVGQDVAYYLQHYRGSQVSDTEPLPSISVAKSQTDWRLRLVCVELDGGKIRWSRVVRSMAHISADPINDDCHVYGRRLITLRALDGEVLRRTEVLSGSRLQGIAYPSGVVLGDEDSTRSLAPHVVVVADSGIKRELVVSKEKTISPDGQYRIERSMPSRSFGFSNLSSFGEVRCIRISDEKRMWAYSLTIPGLSHIRWADGNVYLLSGSENSICELTCLAGVSGELKWGHQLPEGIYRSGGHQLNNGSYAPGWVPLSVEEGRVVVVSSSGKLEILNSETGKLISSFRAARSYICLPRVRNERIIVCTLDGMRAYPLRSGVGTPTWRRMIERIKNSPAELALSQAFSAIHLDLDFHRAYSAAASALEEMGLIDEALFFRARAIEISGLGYDEVLKQRLGLEKVITLNASLSKHLIVEQGHVLAGTQDGRLIAIDPKTYEHRVVMERPKEIRDIHTQVTVSDASSPIAKSVIDLSDFKKPKSQELTPEWRRYNGYTGRVVFWKGNYYRAEPEGTRKWNPDQNVGHFHEGEVQHIAEHSKGWEMELSNAHQLGYGTGGVSKLDSDLRPIEWIVRVPEGTAGSLVINSDTFGVIISSRKNPRAFQIYSHGGELIRSTTTEGLDFLSDQEQFSRIGGGYLISGKEWCWMHPNSEIPINRLSPPDDTIPEIDPWWSDRFNWFSVPLIYDEHIFVISRYGSVYIFNAEKYRGLF